MEKETQYLKIDRKSLIISQALLSAPLFKKYGQVKARLGRVGEEIATILVSGSKETVNKAKEGDWIDTNPSGEQYIISREKFLDRYEQTDEEGVFEAKGYCKAIQNLFGQPIEIMASWGSPQFGDEKCMIADTCDGNGKVTGEPYLIDLGAFNKTYKQVKNG